MRLEHGEASLQANGLSTHSPTDNKQFIDTSIQNQNQNQTWITTPVPTVAQLQKQQRTSGLGLAPSLAEEAGVP